MHLAEVYAENFRIFGSEGDALCLRLKPGINALVGENDGGKSGIIDAIRFCLWTTSQDYHRLTEDDFHCSSSGRAKTLTIRCKFEGLETDDQATFLEWLTAEEDDKLVLYVHLKATLLDGNRRGRVAVETHTGVQGEGPAAEGLMRELLKATYLRPLRDAEAELSPGRNSRLSQILINHPDIASQARNDYDPDDPQSGSTLVGIMKRAEHEVGTNSAVQSANELINSKYLEKFQIGSQPLRSEVGVAGDSTLSKILEKLELVISKSPDRCERTKRGLGYNNALFMSAELLLLGGREAYPTLLIEEPEAHLHPQMQANVISLLMERTDSNPRTGGQRQSRPVQVVLTTHSPNLASGIPLDCITLVSGGRPYSLAQDETRLSVGDYAFLERFLDSTKANMFFARSVLIVEGDAENLLLPALAGALGYSFRRTGVSVVNVGHTGLFRYSNILRRSDGQVVPIPVACIRDRDIVPDHVPAEYQGKLKREGDLTQSQHAQRIEKMKAGDGESVRTFVSDAWTLEYDLAKSSWQLASVMLRSVLCAVDADRLWPDTARVAKLYSEAEQKLGQWKAEGKALEEVGWEIYKPLKIGSASKAITAQFASHILQQTKLTEEDIPVYLVDAFRYVCGTPNNASH